jgi:hypothetical protein
MPDCRHNKVYYLDQDGDHMFYYPCMVGHAPPVGALRRPRLVGRRGPLPVLAPLAPARRGPGRGGGVSNVTDAMVPAS